MFTASGVQRGVFKKACIPGYPLKPFSRKATMSCTFWGGKGECRGGMRVGGTYRRGFVAVGEKVLQHKPYPASQGDLF